PFVCPYSALFRSPPPSLGRSGPEPGWEGTPRWRFRRRCGASWLVSCPFRHRPGRSPGSRSGWRPLAAPRPGPREGPWSERSRVVQPAVEELAGDGDGRGCPDRRRGDGVPQLLASEPSQGGDLGPVRGELTAGCLGGEPEHERTREGPRLGPEVLGICDLEVGLFPDLS